MSQLYHLTRTETVRYRKTFTREELIEAGVPEAALDDPYSWQGEVTDFLSSNESDVVVEFLVDATERDGDVQGNDFAFTRTEV